MIRFAGVEYKNSYWLEPELRDALCALKVSRKLINPDAMSPVKNPRIKQRTIGEGSYRTPTMLGRKNINKQLRAKVWREKGERCHYCPTGEASELDHLIPVNRGGKNLFKNLWPACAWCNLSKNDSTYIEWLERNFRKDCLKA